MYMYTPKKKRSYIYHKFIAASYFAAIPLRKNRLIFAALHDGAMLLMECVCAFKLNIFTVALSLGHIILLQLSL